MSLLGSLANGHGADDLASLEAGLDALETSTASRPLRLHKFVSASWPPLLALALILLVWQLAVDAKLKPAFVLPSPGAVWSKLAERMRDGTLPEAVWTSLRRGGLGFLASLAIGTPLGLLIARVRPVRRAIGPLVSGLQSLPSVAWVPAAVMFFGFSDAAIYAVVLLGAVPSIANGMVSGIDQVPPLFTQVGRVLGARGLRAARFVLLPAALPGYVGGMRQGWAFSWRSLMAAELIAHSPDLGLGLGGLLNEGREQLDMSLVFSGIIAILVVGIAVELCVFAPLERRVLRRRGLLGATS